MMSSRGNIQNGLCALFKRAMKINSQCLWVLHMNPVPNVPSPLENSTTMEADWFICYFKFAIVHFPGNNSNVSTAKYEIYSVKYQ
jgi:hypothetical protein